MCIQAGIYFSAVGIKIQIGGWEGGLPNILFPIQYSVTKEIHYSFTIIKGLYHYDHYDISSKQSKLKNKDNISYMALVWQNFFLLSFMKDI